MIRCEKCTAELTGNEIGLYRKIVHRSAESFLCIRCLAEKLNIPEADLHDMINRFRRAGCTLFAPIDNN